MNPLRSRARAVRLLGIGLVAALAVAVAACDPAPIVEPGDPGAADVTLTIRSDQGVKAISPLIYGSNDDSKQLATGQTVSRLGGNRWTAYNWENNASNAGSDYCFQNDGYLSASNTPGEAVKTRLDASSPGGRAVVITVPIVDYVAADKNGGCDVRNSGANYLTTRFRQNVATTPGTIPATPNTTDGVVYQDQFVKWVQAHHGNAPVLFSLDNEPDLWQYTHAEVHPAATTFAELIERNIRFARAIKGAWPGAPVVGPVNYGWEGFSTLQGAPDRNNRDFLDTYLDQVKAAETTDGHKLIDYLDVHWYPEARGDNHRIIENDTNSAGTVTARVQAPRSLWDPSYTETSWISQDIGIGPITLIPRLQGKIAAHDPGTKLAITEWNYGGGSYTAGGSHISGGVATADVLGVFGRQGVDLATYWPLYPHEEFNDAAFAAFENYDGAGSRFGDTSEQATSSDPTNVTVYSSRDAANPNRRVIIAINKSTSAKTAAIKVACPSTLHAAKVFQLTSASPSMVARPDLATSATNAFKTTLPAMSVTVIVPSA